MKRIKAINGYTIYQSTTQRDVDNYRCSIGDYNIYLSSDIRDYGLSCSYPEWDGVDSLAVAVAMCNGSSYAVAVELAEELSNSTIQDMDLVLEIERRLDAGESLESVRDSYDTDEQCFTRDCFVDPFIPYEDHPSIGQYGVVIPDTCPIDEDTDDRPDDEIACMLWEQDALEPGDYLLAADNTDVARIVSIDRTGTFPSYTVEHPDLSREQWGALHVSRMLGVTTASDRELRRRAVFVWDRLLPELKRCDLLAEEEAETAGLDRGGAEAIHTEYIDGTDGWEQPDWTVYYEGEVFPEDAYTPGARGISRNYYDHHAARKLCRFCEAHGIDVWLKNNRYGYTEHNGEVDC